MSGISLCGFFLPFTMTQITVVLTDWIFAYTVYRFLSAFFPVKQEKNKTVEIVSYFLFWIIGSIQFLFCNTIVANIIYNLLSVFLITFNYDGKMQIRILAPLMIYVTGAAVEFMTAGFNTNAYFLKSPEGSVTIANIIEDRILFFTVGTLVSKLKNIKVTKQKNISFGYFLRSRVKGRKKKGKNQPIYLDEGRFRKILEF